MATCSQNKDYITINPELIPQVLSNKESDIFILWLVMKRADKNGSGFVCFSQILEVASTIFNFQSTYVYKIFNKGINKYWSDICIHKGKKSTSLYGFGKVITRLSPKVSKSKCIALPFFLFENSSTKAIKQILIALFAARFEDPNPISILALSKILHLSESTIRNAIKECNLVDKIFNFEILEESSSKAPLVSIILNSDHPWGMRIIEQDEKFLLVKQISNSYKIKDLNFLPYEYRPKELKKIDKTLLEILPKKLYSKKDNNIFANGNKVIVCEQ